MAKFDYPDTKGELIARLDAARAGMTRAMDGVRVAADVPSRFRHSFGANKTAWITAAGVAGLILAKLPARKKTVKISRKKPAQTKASMAMSALKIAAGLAQPFLIAYVKKRAGHHDERR